MNLLGIDVGGTFIKYGLFDGAGKLLEEDKVRTANDFESFCGQVREIVGRGQRRQGVQALGVGVPGFIAKREKRIELSPNIAFLQGVYLQRELEQRLGLPVIVENDANVAGLGEYISLPEPRPESFVLLTLGTGIGSGIILQGAIWQGECGYGAELGHVTVNSDGRACGCGNRGCVETESSEPGIVRSYQELSGQTAPLSARDVHRLWQQGDGQARAAFQRAGRFLGILFVTIANFLNPAVIVLGGGVAAAGEAILEPARAEFSQRLHPLSVACTRIGLASQGNRAGIIGAAHLARLRSA